MLPRRQALCQTLRIIQQTLRGNGVSAAIGDHRRSGGV
jgi:hypothetical protein